MDTSFKPYVKKLKLLPIEKRGNNFVRGLCFETRGYQEKIYFVAAKKEDLVLLLVGVSE